ncbi:MAG: hypothetical protein FWJ66_13230 [Caldibacillus sp.]
MNRFTFAMFFLYFPEDKTEYIPAVISFSIFLVFCILTFLWVKKISRKQEERAKEMEKRLLMDALINNKKNKSSSNKKTFST